MNLLEKLIVGKKLVETKEDNDRVFIVANSLDGKSDQKKLIVDHNKNIDAVLRPVLESRNDVNNNDVDKVIKKINRKFGGDGSCYLVNSFDWAGPVGSFGVDKTDKGTYFNVDSSDLITDATMSIHYLGKGSEGVARRGIQTVAVGPNPDLKSVIKNEHNHVIAAPYFVTSKVSSSSTSSYGLRGFKDVGAVFADKNVSPVRELARTSLQEPVAINLKENMLISKYVGGVSLDKILHHKKVLDNDDILLIASHILLAEQELNNADLIHRDYKPDNIMLSSNGDVVVMDYGALKKNEETNDENQLTMQVINNDFSKATTFVIGSQGYVSPEIASQYISALNSSSSNDGPSIQFEVDPAKVCLYRKFNTLDEAHQYEISRKDIIPYRGAEWVVDGNFDVRNDRIPHGSTLGYFDKEENKFVKVYKDNKGRMRPVNADERSDLYSIGLMLGTAMTGFNRQSLKGEKLYRSAYANAKKEVASDCGEDKSEIFMAKFSKRMQEIVYGDIADSNSTLSSVKDTNKSFYSRKINSDQNEKYLKEFGLEDSLLGKLDPQLYLVNDSFLIATDETGKLLDKYGNYSKSLFEKNGSKSDFEITVDKYKDDIGKYIQSSNVKSNLKNKDLVTLLDKMTSFDVESRLSTLDTLKCIYLLRNGEKDIFKKGLFNPEKYKTVNEDKMWNYFCENQDKDRLRVKELVNEFNDNYG